MTLTDAGPLVALIDADEADHDMCRLVLAGLELPLVTTWPAFTEAMYLLSRAGGPVGRESLWKLALSGRLDIVDLSPAEVERSAHLMEKYSDLPMDLADATLVALAEERGERRVFTLDSDFEVYRLNGRQRFHIVPTKA
ncbi:PIN domain-containing protein [soil metagenome]